MKDHEVQTECTDCTADVSRRRFMTQATGVALAAGTLSNLPLAMAAPTKKSGAESAVAELYSTLSSDQKAEMVLPYDDPRRTKISANWAITKARIGSFTKPQQELIHKIIQGITSEDGYERLQKQMAHDWGSVEKYAIAIFGDPSADKFQFELTGRHLTLRADGDTLPGAAFGGPIVYGHGIRGNSPKNLFSYQTKQANEVFAMLDKKQRVKALLPKAPRESAVQLRDDVAQIPGIGGEELSAEQKKLVAAALEAVMKPYRKDDVDEVMKIVEASGGIDKLHMAFYESGDLDNDTVWDNWRVEGPSLVCHFRGSPHVHAYINVRQRDG